MEPSSRTSRSLPVSSRKPPGISRTFRNIIGQLHRNPPEHCRTLAWNLPEPHKTFRATASISATTFSITPGASKSPKTLLKGYLVNPLVERVLEQTPAQERFSLQAPPGKLLGSMADGFRSQTMIKYVIPHTHRMRKPNGIYGWFPSSTVARKSVCNHNFVIEHWILLSLHLRSMGLLHDAALKGAIPHPAAWVASVGTCETSILPDSWSMLTMIVYIIVWLRVRL